MFASMRKAGGLIFQPAFSSVVIKSVVLTLVLFVILFVGLQFALDYVPQLGWEWLNTAIDWIASLLFVVVLFFLGAPVAAVFASLFLDDIAEAVEKNSYPADPPASGVGFWVGLMAGLRLGGWVLLLNLLLLPVTLFVPFFGPLITLLVNGWLLGREFFELSALRHLSTTAAKQMRNRHRFAILLGGIVIAFFTMIPGVNLVAPLFGAAFMAHEFKRFHHEERPA